MGLFVSRNTGQLPFARPRNYSSYVQSLQNQPPDDKPIRLDRAYSALRKKYAKEKFRLIEEIDLPLDVLREIFSKLSPKDLLQLRLVCKSWSIQIWLIFFSGQGKVNLKNFCVDDDTVRDLASSGFEEHLSVLSLRWCNRITDKGVSYLVGMPNLKNLSLSCCDKVLLKPQPLPPLITSLDLTFLEHISDRSLETLNQLKHLKELTLTHTNITSLYYLAPNNTLETLIMAKCYKLKPTTIISEIVERFPNLKLLSFMDCGALDMNTKFWESLNKIKLKTLNLESAFPWANDNGDSAVKLKKLLRKNGCRVIGLNRYLPFGQQTDDELLDLDDPLTKEIAHKMNKSVRKNDNPNLNTLD